MVQPFWMLIAIGGESLENAFTPLVQLGTAALLPLVLGGLRSKADGHYRTAETLRRAIRRIKGLGVLPTPSQHAEFAASATAKKSDEPEPLGAYYSSAREVGPDRLAHLIQEETFYTRELARRSRDIAWVGVVVIVAAAFIVLYGALHLAATGLAGDQANIKFASASLAIVGLGVSGTFIELARSYAALADSAEVAYEQVKALADRRDVTLLELLPVMEAYDCAPAAAAPIPTMIYRLHRDRLDAAFRTAHAPASPGDRQA